MKTDLQKASQATYADMYAQTVSENEESDNELSVEETRNDETDTMEELLHAYDRDTRELELIHSKVTSIQALGLDHFTNIKTLGLRQNFIAEIEALPPTLADLDLYDNRIKHISGLDHVNLENLDLSFNKIKHIRHLNHMTELTNLYFVQNKIGKIENLEGLPKLRNLELGANRIREMENLDSLTGLEELWLGKNKISRLQGVSSLVRLQILSLQSNRLTEISGLENLKSLREFYVSHNAITKITGLEANTQLRVLDISANPIYDLQHLSSLALLEELWASSCKISSFAQVEQELKPLEHLTTVYFEHNPLQTSNQATYRNKVRFAIPQIKQIDATFVRI